MVISLFILCFASTLAFSSTNKEKQLEALSDSVSNKIGQKDFIPFYQEYMRLARQQNDTAKIDDAYSQIASHYYRLRNTDSLKVVAYEYMDWCLKRGNINNRYTQWRQYIQLLTEKGLQDEAMRETGLLQKDADAAKSAFGMACSEMCIGYNHRVFSNNVKLCLEYYSSALKKFSDAGFYLSGTCIWKKQSLVLGRSPYQWQHEPILFGWKKSGKHEWYTGRKESTIWEFDKPRKNADHPTMKPVPLLAYPIMNSSMSNCIVLDPFGGSGSTLIACEQTDRICYTIELDEKFCDVIVNRFIEQVGSSENVEVVRDGVTYRYEEMTSKNISES